jgi:hypothetical protein
MTARPPRQRWIKRPPRPRAPRRARAGAGAAGIGQFLVAIGFGVCAGLLGRWSGRADPEREGMAGLFAGFGLVLGFLGVWRGLGGTRQDIRNLFK